jgi:hypothetical protein
MAVLWEGRAVLVSSMSAAQPVVVQCRVAPWKISP